MLLSTCCDAIPHKNYEGNCSWCKEHAEFYLMETVMRIEVDDVTGEHIYKKVEVIPKFKLAMCDSEERDKRERK